MRSGVAAFVLILAIGSTSSADDCYKKYTDRTAAIDKALRESLRSTAERQRAIDYDWEPGDGGAPVGPGSARGAGGRRRSKEARV